MPELSDLDTKLLNEREILALRNELLLAINAASVRLQTAEEAITDRAYDRSLSEGEQKERREIRHAIAALDKAAEEVAYISLRWLNESGEVQRLSRVLEHVTEDLEHDLARIQRIAAIVKNVADILGLINRAIGVLTRLAALA